MRHVAGAFLASLADEGAAVLLDLEGGTVAGGSTLLHPQAPLHLRASRRLELGGGSAGD